MEILIELIISIGSAISAAIGGFITARQRRAKSHQSQTATSVVEFHVDGEESEPVRMQVPSDVASRLLNEARQDPDSMTLPDDTLS
jgi:hypothetical protein